MKMRLLLFLFASSVLFPGSGLCSAPSLGTPPQSMSLEQGFGKPIFSYDYKGVGFRVFSAGGLKIVAVTPPGVSSPAFLSFVREGGQLDPSEIQQFLENFAGASGARWRVFDRSSADRALQFFMSAPYANQAAAQQMLSALPDPAAAATAWERMVRDPQARTEASNFLDMLRAQKQMWISENGQYLATLSPDGSALGVGIVPPAAR
jgi:hypothetical protein